MKQYKVGFTAGNFDLLHPGTFIHSKMQKNIVKN